MGRVPCYYKKGLWSPEEDEILVDYIHQHGIANWSSLAKNSGLQRCGKSCRLRWVNYLRPDIKLGCFTPQEKERVMELQATLGNRWSVIATHLPGRTDNEIKNVWNVHLKKLVTIGLDPQTHELNNTPDEPSSKSPKSDIVVLNARVDTCQTSKPSTNRDDEEIGLKEDSKSQIVVQHAISDSCCSNVVDDSSKSFVQLLLDCHANSDMSFSKSQLVQHARSDSCSNVVDDSSKSFVQLLLDCHANNDISFSKSQIVPHHARSDFSCSNMADDSSKSYSQPLLDCNEDNDMSFSEDHIIGFW